MILVKALVQELNNETKNETQTATLICKSQGDPRPEMKFSKQGHKPFTVGVSKISLLPSYWLRTF